MSAFVGRRAELDLTHAALDEADGILVSGVAGIGKSLLLAEIEQHLSLSERRTIRLPTSTATASISLWPFQHLLPQSPPSDLLDLARHVHHHLRELGGSERITLFVDDVQHLDEASIGMLDHLLAGGHIRLAATMRSGEPHLDSLDALWSRFDVRELPLDGLPVTDCSVIVERLLGGPASTDAITHLTDVARGNPLLLRELTLDAVENGALQDSSTGWRLVQQEEAATEAIGDRTRLCVQRRLSRLGPDEQDLVTLLAVAGDLRPDIVPSHLAPALEQLEARRLAVVRAERPGEWTAHIDHPLLAEVVLRDVTGSTRRDALRRLVDYTRRADLDAPGTATRLAVWAEASGDGLAASEWLRATDEAVATFDHETAARWAHRAVQADPTSHAAHLALGGVLRHQGRLPEAVRAYEMAERCAGSDQEVATAAIEHATLVALPLGRPRDAVAALRTTEQRLGGGEHALALRSEAAVLGSLLGSFDEFLFEPSHDVDEVASDAVRWQLGLNELYSRTMVGRVGGIDDLTARTIHCFPAVATQRPQELDYVLGLRGAARIVRGEAIVGLDELGRFVQERRDQGAYRGISGMILAHMLGLACHPDAIATAHDAVDQHEWIDPLGSAPIALAIASMVVGATGDLDAAEDLAARGDAGSEPWRSIWVGRARAQVHHLRGDDAAARDLCAAASRTAIDTSHVIYAAVTAHDLVRYGDPAAAAALLDEVVADTDGCRYLGLLRRHAHAVTAADRTELRCCAHELVDHGSPWLSAACHHQLASIALADGDQLAARRFVAAGDVAFDRLHPFHPSPAPEVPDALSPREREVAALAVVGLTSATIAEQLGRSIRTVDNHLHRAYRKLAVEGRDELKEVLEPRRSGPAADAAD